jgi:hypothetical protein
MARDFGRILARIWDDREFCSLTDSAQRMYMLLLSQPELNHAGLLPMRLKRWSTMAAGYTPDRVMTLLKELDRTRFALFDEDTEEVWVRTLVRNDGIYRQPKVMIRMEKDAEQIKSHRIRAAFAAELGRIPLNELDASYQFETARDVIWRLLDRLPEPQEATEVGYEDEYAEGYPEGYPASVGKGYAIPPAGARAQPPPPNPNQTHSSDAVASTPDPLFDDAADSAAATTGKTKRTKAEKPPLDPLFLEFWAVWPRKDGKAEAVTAWPKAIKKATAEAIITGAIRYRDDPERTPRYTKMPGPWLNAERWNDGIEKSEDQRPSGWGSYFGEVGA